MARYTPAKFVQTAAVPTSETTQYTVPASTSGIVKEIILNNTSTAAITVGVSLVASGGTAGTGNRIFGDYAIAGSTVVVIDLSQVMNTADFISAKASAAGVNITVSGVTFQ